jgi:serine protease Do
VSLPPRAAAPVLLLLLALSSSACRRQTDATLRAPCEPAALLASVPEPDPSVVVTRARASVVSVVAGHPAEGVRELLEPRGSPRAHALGSGILLTSDGLVLTSRHVIDGADDVRVELDDGRSFEGRVVARDALLDIALVRLAGARGLPVAELGSSEAIRAGEPVIAIGNPFGLGPSVRRGVLSAPAREVGEGPAGELLQNDAAVNPGDSGGPLLDARGRVIGVNTAIVEHGQGLSLAVPIDDVRAVLPELETTGRVTRGHAGLSFQPVDAALARALSMPQPSGAIVTDVEDRGPADRAGIRAGDVITAMDGRSIQRSGDVAHELERRKPGEVVRMGVLRAGAPRALALLLDWAPNRDGDAEPRTARAGSAAGTAGLRLVDADGEGARIEALDPASTAADGLRTGDVVIEVNRVPVTSADDVTRGLRRAPRPSTALLRVRREGDFLYVGIDLGS